MTGLATDVPTPLALADGTTAEARGIEAALCHNTFVGDAIVIADGSGRLGALLAIDQTAITDWAQALSLSFTTPAELLALPEVRQLIGEQVAAGNATLPPQQRIERYRLLDAPPAGASAEASLSRVLQRRIALQGQASQGEGLFADPPGPGIEVVQAIAARMRKEAA